MLQYAKSSSTEAVKQCNGRQRELIQHAYPWGWQSVASSPLTATPTQRKDKALHCLCAARAPLSPLRGREWSLQAHKQCSGPGAEERRGPEWGRGSSPVQAMGSVASGVRSASECQRLWLFVRVLRVAGTGGRRLSVSDCDCACKFRVYHPPQHAVRRGRTLRPDPI